MQSELLQQLSWPFYGDLEMEGHVGDHEFSLPFTTTEESSGIFSEVDQFPPAIVSVEFREYAMPGKEFPILENIEDDMEGIESISEDVYGWFAEGTGKDVWSPCQSTRSSESSVVFPLVQSPLTLLGEGDQIDSQLSLQHLLKAYGEAMEMEQRELTKVIKTSIAKKASPAGEALERLAFYLFLQSMDKQGEYLNQESTRNFQAAFKAFYQIFPYGRFAHFAANQAILEAIPEEAEMVHVIDFDMREGVQWPPLMEAIAQKQKTLRLTSIRTEEKFEETRRQLHNHARSCGLHLRVEEVGIEDLGVDLKREVRREYLAFNCMVGLPHMGRGRTRSHVMEFLRVAKEVLGSSGNQGIVVIGEGDGAEELDGCSSYGSFFDRYLNHYRALCESMEWSFPVCLAEARITMENLFVSPFVSSLSWVQKWEEARQGLDLRARIGLKRLRVSEENIMGAKELVKAGESLYTTKIEGDRGNEMVLEWRGTPLVRVSTWR
ncbi:hypothetical protein NMG60_11035998 [Bertholletia excelsa]